MGGIKRKAAKTELEIVRLHLPPDDKPDLSKTKMPKELFIYKMDPDDEDYDDEEDSGEEYSGRYDVVNLNKGIKSLTDGTEVGRYVLVDAGFVSHESRLVTNKPEK